MFDFQLFLHSRWIQLIIKVIFEYEFLCGTNASETALNVNTVFGENTANENFVIGLTAFVVEA